MRKKVEKGGQDGRDICAWTFSHSISNIFIGCPHWWPCENPHLVFCHHPFVLRDTPPPRNMHLVPDRSSIHNAEIWGTLYTRSARLLCQLKETSEWGYRERGFGIFFSFFFNCNLKPVLPESCPAKPSLGFSHCMKHSFLVTSLGSQTLVYTDLFGKRKP